MPDSSARRPPVKSLVEQFATRRNVDVSARTSVPCPSQNLILVLGQSNAANYVGERFRSTAGAVDWLDGTCYPSAGPTLGSDGNGGSVWPLVGDLVCGEDGATYVEMTNPAEQLLAVGGDALLTVVARAGFEPATVMRLPWLDVGVRHWTSSFGVMRGQGPT